MAGNVVVRRAQEVKLHFKCIVGRLLQPHQSLVLQTGPVEPSAPGSAAPAIVSGVKPKLAPFAAFGLALVKRTKDDRARFRAPTELNRRAAEHRQG